MQFDKYQEEANKLNIVAKEFKMIHALLGLSGEAGEVAEKFKKMYRDKHGKMDKEFLSDVSKELGDTLWFLADVCTQIGLSLNDVAKENLKKLKSRRDRGVQRGSGDNR